MPRKRRASCAREEKKKDDVAQSSKNKNKNTDVCARKWIKEGRRGIRWMREKERASQSTGGK